MKNFKSIIAAFAAALMLFSLTACQNNASVDTDRDVTVASSETAVTNATENTNETISVELSTTTATESTTIATTNSKGETVKATKADNNNAVVKTTTKKSSSSSNNSSYKAPATTKKSSSSSNNVKATTKKSSSSAKPQTTTKKSTSSSNNSTKMAYDETRGEYMDSATAKTVFTYEDGTKTVGYFTSGHGSATYIDTDGFKRTVTDHKAFTGALTYCPYCGRNLMDSDHFMDAGKNGTCYHTYMGEDTCLFCNAKIGAGECHSCGDPAYTCRVCGKKVAKGEKHRHNP